MTGDSEKNAIQNENATETGIIIISYLILTCDQQLGSPIAKLVLRKSGTDCIQRGNAKSVERVPMIFLMQSFPSCISLIVILVP